MKREGDALVSEALRSSVFAKQITTQRAPRHATTPCRSPRPAGNEGDPPPSARCWRSHARHGHPQVELCTGQWSRREGGRPRTRIFCILSDRLQ